MGGGSYSVPGYAAPHLYSIYESSTGIESNDNARFFERPLLGAGVNDVSSE